MKNGLTKPANTSVRVKRAVSRGVEKTKFAFITMLICIFPIITAFAYIPNDDVTNNSNMQEKAAKEQSITQMISSSIIEEYKKGESKNWFELTLTKMKSTGEIEKYYSEADKIRLAQIEKEKEAERLRLEKYKAEQARIAKEREDALKNSRYYINRYSDLSNKNIRVTPEEMNAIIEDWEQWNGGSQFRGHGNTFVKASEISGLDPIYIFAHAAWESDWGRSYLARTKANYFGINAVDIDPSLAHHMGNSMDDGIINGANWISHNYYQEGSTTLDLMIYGPKQYATGADSWIGGISSIMSDSYAILRRVRGV